MKIMPVQKQTRAGQRTRFKSFVVVGDGNGQVGLGVKCSKEVATAIRGTIILTKLSVIPVRRGYWGNKIGKPHTVPCKVTGKSGSVTVLGAGIVATRVPKKVLQLAGIEDVFTSSRGSTKTLGNFVKNKKDMAISQENFLLGARDQRWSLKGMTALVTGGTRGIGHAIVEELAGFGAKVHTCSRTETELNERIQEWQGKGFQVSGSTCDLASKTQREELMKTVASVFDGKLNILINNAAITIMKRAMDHTEEDFWELIKTNLESPHHLCQIAYPLLKASGKANIVFISSVAGKMALPGLSLYSACKGAINQLTRNLAYEWGKDNIRVNAVAPWAVNTTICKPLNENIRDMSLQEMFVPLLARTPMGPFAESHEISPLAAFLCLPAASFITGQVIYVDGGFTTST